MSEWEKMLFQLPPHFVIAVIGGGNGIFATLEDVREHLSLLEDSSIAAVGSGNEIFATQHVAIRGIRYE